jgi:hypothetical protein
VLSFVICVLESIKSVRSASGGWRKNALLRTSAFSSISSSRLSSWFLNCGTYDDRGELLLVHFATFYNLAMELETISPRSLCAVLRALGTRLTASYKLLSNMCNFQRGITGCFCDHLHLLSFQTHNNISKLVNLERS